MSNLPNIPKFPKRVCSSELDGSIPVVNQSIALRESNDINYLLQERAEGRALSVSLDSPIARYHGCRSCPWYASTFCFEKIVPPKTFPEGICSGRLGEILDIAELHGSPNGLEIRKRETVERIRRHILSLEAHLSDYSFKRMELIKELAKKPLRDEEGLPINPEDKNAMDSAVAERTLKLCQYDSYQRGIQSNLQILSLKFAELLRDDEKLAISKGEGSGRKVLNIQQLSNLLSDSAKRLKELEDEKDKIINITPK